MSLARRNRRTATAARRPPVTRFVGSRPPWNRCCRRLQHLRWHRRCSAVDLSRRRAAPCFRARSRRGALRLPRPPRARDGSCPCRPRRRSGPAGRGGEQQKCRGRIAAARTPDRVRPAATATHCGDDPAVPARRWRPKHLNRLVTSPQTDLAPGRVLPRRPTWQRVSLHPRAPRRLPRWSAAGWRY